MSYREWRQFDIPLLAGVLFLVSFGVILIYSGSRTGPESADSIASDPVTRQIAYASVGLILMFVVARIDYRVLLGASWILYAISLVALFGVLFVTEATYGSHRWYDLGPFQAQPSEIAKLATILVLARFLSESGARVRTAKVFLLSFVILAGPMSLVFVSPDLGTSIVFFSLWLGMVIMAGVNLKHVGYFALSILLLIPFGMVLAISDYQRERIELFLDPEKDPLGKGFNILQAEISIGSGGLFGRGLLQGTQTQFDYLRTQTTDYVFSVLGEELGFFGAMILFSMFIFVLFRGVRAAGRSRDMAGRLIATGIVVQITAMAFINVAVNLHLFPVTGIPLPFISQGGSSLISVFISLGVLQSITMRHRTAIYR